MRWLFSLLLPFLFVAQVNAATYYIDASGGNDNNVGTDTAHPWAHLKCMPTVVGGSTAATHTPVAGDTFVLKGGETWHNVDLPCTWTWSGTAGSRITVTVDPTWYTGGSWTRPIWNADGVAIVGPIRVAQGINYNVNAFLDMYNNVVGVNYVTFDNLEMTGYFWTGIPGFATYGGIIAGTGHDMIIDHLYFHGWTHDTLGNGTQDGFNPIMGVRNGTAVTRDSTLQNSVIDGSDGTGGGDSGRNYLWPNYVNNVIHDLVSGIVGGASGTNGTVTISGNQIYNIHASFDSSFAHPNVLETLGSVNITTYYIYNNVFHDSNAAAESAYLANINTGNVTMYVWNNIWYNMLGNSTEFEADAVGYGTKSIYYWNNTVVPKAGTYCQRHSTKAGNLSPVFKIQNNHCISTVADSDGVEDTINATSLVVDHNLIQTPAAATAQGYTSSQNPYVYYPTAGGSTILTGINLSSNCAVLAGLCFDTTYAATIGANHTVVVGARTPFARSGTLAWDIGLYQYADALPRPAAPSGLQLISSADNSLATLIWTPNTESDLSGYYVYTSNQSGVYLSNPVATLTPSVANSHQSSVTRYIARFLIPGVTYFTVSAFNTDNTESAKSTEISFNSSGYVSHTAATTRSTAATRTAR